MPKRSKKSEVVMGPSDNNIAMGNRSVSYQPTEGEKLIQKIRLWIYREQLSPFLGKDITLNRLLIFLDEIEKK